MYVGNLPFSATQEEITEIFAAHGEVQEVFVATDRETGRPRGFAFVTMATREAMEAAIKGLDGQTFGGRPLKVNEARPREDRPPRREGGGYRDRDRGDRGDRDRGDRY